MVPSAFSGEGGKFTTINDSDLSLNSLERTETWRSLLDTGEISGLSRNYYSSLSWLTCLNEECGKIFNDFDNNFNDVCRYLFNKLYLYFEEYSVELPLFALHRWYINLFVNN